MGVNSPSPIHPMPNNKKDPVGTPGELGRTLDGTTDGSKTQRHKNASRSQGIARIRLYAEFAEGPALRLHTHRA